MTEFTANLRLGIPDFNQEPWHQSLEDTIRAIDAVISEALLLQNTDLWLNSTVYAVGDIVIDPQTGLFWTCGVANTSAASPTLFATERTNHPTYWNASATIPQQRGTWLTATSYIPGDFVVDSGRYAVCIVAHVSGVFNTDLAAGKWVVLIDTSTVGAGINNTAEDSIASATTTNIGSKTSSRLLVTGNTTITGFGVVANTFKILRYQGILTLTHNATSLILFGGANRNTAAGDIQWIVSDGTGNWRELMYNRGDGSPVSLPQASTTVQGKVELATAAETQALTDPDRAVTPFGLASALSDLTTSILSTLRNGVGATLDTLKEIADAISLLAPIANPTFTGVPSAPTAAAATNTIQIASTAFTQQEITGRDKVYWLQDSRASGSAADALSSGTSLKRTIQTEVLNEITGASLAGSVITLPAGTYEVEIDAAIGATGSSGLVTQDTENFHRISLRNTSDSTSPILGLGYRHRISYNLSSGTISLSYLSHSVLRAKGKFTVAAPKTFEVRHYASGPSVGTMGHPMSSGENEVYLNVYIKKISL